MILLSDRERSQSAAHAGFKMVVYSTLPVHGCRDSMRRHTSGECVSMGSERRGRAFFFASPAETNVCSRLKALPVGPRVLPTVIDKSPEATIERKIRDKSYMAEYWYAIQAEARQRRACCTNHFHRHQCLRMRGPKRLPIHPFLSGFQ